MNLAEFVAKFLRRPILLAVIVILAVVAGVLGMKSAKAEYETTATMVVIPPGSGSPDAGLNPLINLNNNIAQLAVIVATTVQTTDAANHLTERNGARITAVTTTAGDASSFAQLSPQIVFTTRAADPDSARLGAESVIDYAREQLIRIQAEAAVPPRNNALIVVGAKPAMGEPVGKGGPKAAAAYALAVVTGGILAILIADAILEWWRRRRSAQPRRRRGAPAGPAPGSVKAAVTGNAAVFDDARTEEIRL